jgi:hypothetical protein
MVEFEEHECPDCGLSKFKGECECHKQTEKEEATREDDCHPDDQTGFTY